jgi:hypothetical protein
MEAIMILVRMLALPYSIAMSVPTHSCTLAPKLGPLLNMEILPSCYRMYALHTALAYTACTAPGNPVKQRPQRPRSASFTAAGVPA